MNIIGENYHSAYLLQNYVIDNCNLCILSCHVGQYSFDGFCADNKKKVYPIQNSIERNFRAFIIYNPSFYSQFVKKLTQ
jgi:hypothetical protein